MVTNASGRCVAVIGGSSQVAFFLVPRLLAAGHRVVVFSRGVPPWTYEAEVVRCDGAELPQALSARGPVDALLWLPPLLVLPGLLTSLRSVGVKRSWP